MRKTLLLCFIHGFKGDDDTFGAFPEHLRTLVSHALPKVTVTAVTYPTFETRGVLNDCVTRFREWLQNKVIDLEVSASTPSPTIDPSVRVILIGHSMGGIVAAETLLSIVSDPPIHPSPASSTDSTSPLPSTAAHTDPPYSSQRQSDESLSPSTFMFPYIQGLLAFDTPYLGISPSLIAHGAQANIKAASSAYSNFSELAGSFGWGAASSKSPSPSPAQPRLAAGPESAKDALAAGMADDAAATPAWQRWGKYAMFAGAAGAVAAGGAAAYLKRESITEGWSWVGSHLEFVGCLVRGEELKSRLERIVALKESKSIGFVDMVTVLGQGAVGTSHNSKEAKTFAGGWVEISPTTGHERSERTFCTIPKSGRNRRCFEKAVNEKALDETKAHMTMFFPRDNPGYYAMGQRAKELVSGWVEEGWYEGSEGGAGEGLGLDEVEEEGREEMDGEASLGGEAPVLVEEENVWKE